MGHPPTIWDKPGVIDKLKRLVREGFTGGQIAQRLGGQVTRNAVIGKANRLGLQLRGGKPKTPEQLELERERQRVAKARRERRYRLAKRAQEIPAEAPSVPRTIPASRDERGQAGIIHTGVDALVNLRPHQCRWIEGDPKDADYHFCTRDAESLTASYCSDHQRRSYWTLKERKDKAAGLSG